MKFFFLRREEHPNSRTGFQRQLSLHELITKSNIYGNRKPGSCFLLQCLLQQIQWKAIYLIYCGSGAFREQAFYLFICLLVLVIMQFSRMNAVLVYINKAHALARLPASRDASSNSSWAGNSLIRQRTAIGLCPSVQIRISLTGNNQPLSELLFPFAIRWIA